MNSQTTNKRTNGFLSSFPKRDPNSVTLKRKQAAIFCLVLMIFSPFLLCISDRTIPVIPSDNNTKNGPVEDTTRIYINPMNGDTLEIYPEAIYARFFQLVDDTSKIMELIQKHNLQLYYPLFTSSRQWVAVLCVADNRRAEFHFTPYGQEGFENFGADSLVEYAFGIFSNGNYFPSGNIIFKFIDGTSQSRIDSLFHVKGLRFLWTRPDYPSGERHWTVVTPESNKNVLDLGLDLHAITFIDYFSIEFCVVWSRIDCDTLSKGVCHEKEK